MAFLSYKDTIDKIDRVLSSLDLSKKFVIFPYGSLGKKVKRILDVHQGGTIVVDNGLAGTDGVISFEEFKTIDISDRIVLLCSNRESCYNELREQLFSVVAFEQVVDVFSFSMYYDSKIYWDGVYCSDDRVAALELAAREIYRNNVKGVTAECGVFEGDFSKSIARFLPDRTLYLFDTFEGFDKRDLVNDRLPDSLMDEFDNTSVEKVLDNIGHHVDVVVRKGWFPDTTVGLEDKRYALVSLDTDLYDPILSGLKYFWPRMSPGGYIFVHDFGGLHGVNKAVMEFCRKMKIGYTRLPDYATSAIIQKPLEN